MKYSELDNFMSNFLDPLDIDFNELEVVFLPSASTYFIADELIYQSLRTRADSLRMDCPSKNQLVRWFKEKNIYGAVVGMIERNRRITKND